MWTHLDRRTAALHEVFGPVYHSAQKFDRRWSIVELRLPEEEEEWLLDWLRQFNPRDVAGWVSSLFSVRAAVGGLFSNSQMFGAVLLFAGTFICRKTAPEDAVWPHIRKLFVKCPELSGQLFSGGQPRTLTKEIIEDASRMLRLRHVMDEEGTQRWFITLKLQFGFTYRGAKNRLAEWLVGLGRPLAVQYLIDNGPLESKSFQSMWWGLQQYRRGLIDEAQVRRCLQENPWVSEQWIDTIIREAKSRIETLGRGDAPYLQSEDEEVNDDEFCPVKNISLEWTFQQAPRIMIHLDQDRIAEMFSDQEIGELDLFVDGSKVARWLRQADSSWHGRSIVYAEPENDRSRPNLQPHTLSLRTRNGDALLIWGFSDFGIEREVTIFDLSVARVVRLGFERLEARHQYALLCEKDCTIEGCSAERFERKDVVKAAFRLPVPLPEQLRVVSGEFVFWQPVAPEQNTSPTVELSLGKGKVGTLDSREILVLSGLPDNAEKALLLKGRKVVPLESMDDTWTTPTEVTITAPLAAKEQRIRVSYRQGYNSQTVEPRLKLSLRGVAIERNTNDRRTYTTLRVGDVLNKSEDASRLRIWTESCRGNAVIYEGPIRVGRLKNGGIVPGKFIGLGGEIVVHEDNQTWQTGVIVENHGEVRGYTPPLLDCHQKIEFERDVDLEEYGPNAYSIWAWTGKESLKRIEGTPTKRGKRTWCLNSKEPCNPMAIALTFGDAWKGGWWDLGRIAVHLSSLPGISERQHAILRCLHIPLLNPLLEPAIRTHLVKDSSDFVKIWLKDWPMMPIRYSAYTEGSDVVVRHFLWNRFNLSAASQITREMVGADIKHLELRECVTRFLKLCDISPILAWTNLCDLLHARKESVIPVLEDARNMLLRLEQGHGRTEVIEARLRDFAYHVGVNTGLEDDDIEDMAYRWLESMRAKKWFADKGDEASLLTIGQNSMGRKYFAARMCHYWLELSK